MKRIEIIGLMVLLFGAPASAKEAVDLSRNWGLGAFGALYVPFFSFRNMYTESSKLGGEIHYAFSPRRIVEAEYHYAKFAHGSLEERTFRFSDGKDYKSPQAKSNMKFNSVAVNWLLALKGKGFGQGGAPYVTFGAGFYDYSNKVSGLIYPAQTPSSQGAPPNQSILLEPTNDRQIALSVNFGGGIQIFFSRQAALDLRARYNIVIGELRPFAVWGIEKTSPFYLLDVGAGLKFYIPSR